MPEALPVLWALKHSSKQFEIRLKNDRTFIGTNLKIFVNPSLVKSGK